MSRGPTPKAVTPDPVSTAAGSYEQRRWSLPFLVSVLKINGAPSSAAWAHSRSMRRVNVGVGNEKYRLGAVEERLHGATIAGGQAFGGDQEVECARELIGLAEIVDDAGGKAAAMGGTGQPEIERQLVRAVDGKARRVGIAVEVSQEHAIEAARGTDRAAAREMAEPPGCGCRASARRATRPGYHRARHPAGHRRPGAGSPTGRPQRSTTSRRHAHATLRSAPVRS